MKTTRFTGTVLCFLLVCAIFTGCGSKNESQGKTNGFSEFLESGTRSESKSETEVDLFYEQNPAGDKPINNVIYVNVDYTNEMLAPLPPENVPDISQHTRSSRDESGLISEPTPTPRPTMVYCNDNGQYYHLAGCRYVYEGKTPKVTLTQAKNAGKTACPYCNPPKEETYND